MFYSLLEEQLWFRAPSSYIKSLIMVFIETLIKYYHTLRLHYVLLFKHSVFYFNYLFKHIFHPSVRASEKSEVRNLFFHQTRHAVKTLGPWKSTCNHILNYYGFANFCINHFWTLTHVLAVCSTFLYISSCIIYLCNLMLMFLLFDVTVIKNIELKRLI